jgi:hypothetical protein
MHHAMPSRDYFTPRNLSPSGKRRLPRLRTELIQCELGEVLNVSLAGARIRTAQRLKAGAPRIIAIRGFDLTAGPIHAQVVWCKDGEAGLRFLKASPPVRKILSDLAMMARERKHWAA